MLLAFLAQVVLAQNPVAVRHPTPTRTRFIHADDFPFQARQHGWQGAVVADLTISARGTVDKCDIAKSSGYKLLDDTTCQILVERARFQPARDKDGNAVEDMFRTPEIGWKVSQ
jgi:TonB family protein